LISCHIGITDKDKNALYEACKTLPYLKEDMITPNSIPCLKFLPKPIYGLKLEQSFNRDTERVPISQAVGRISLELVEPVPPGVVLLDIGEII